MKRFLVLLASIALLAVPYVSANAVSSLGVDPANGNPYAITHFGKVGQIDSYRYADYSGILPGVVSSAWSPLPNAIFTPDGNRGASNGGGADSPNFSSLSVKLNHSDVIGSGNYFFADVDEKGPSGKGKNGENYDPFSPNTTSATGATVPEPGTFLLLGSGLIGLAGWGRKMFRM